MSKAGRPPAGEKAFTNSVKVRIDADTYAALLEQSQKDGTTVANIVRIAINAFLKDNGGR
jgi:hypothetical protein